MLCTLRTLLGLSFLSIVKWCLTMIYSEVDDGIKIAMKSSFERCRSKLQSNLSGWCWVGWHVGCNKIHSCPMHLPFSKHSNGSPIFKGKFGPRIQKQTSAGSIRFQNARLFGEHTQTRNTRKSILHTHRTCSMYWRQPSRTSCWLFPPMPCITFEDNGDLGWHTPSQLHRWR